MKNIYEPPKSNLEQANYELPVETKRPKVTWVLIFTLFLYNSIISSFLKTLLLEPGAKVSDGGLVQIVLIAHVVFFLYLIRGVYRLDKIPLYIAVAIYTVPAFKGIYGLTTENLLPLIFLTLPSIYFIYLLNTSSFKKVVIDFRRYREYQNF